MRARPRKAISGYGTLGRNAMQHRQTTFIFAGTAALGLMLAGAAPAIADTDRSMGEPVAVGMTAGTTHTTVARDEERDRRIPDESCPA